MPRVQLTLSRAHVPIAEHKLWPLQANRPRWFACTFVPCFDADPKRHGALQRTIVTPRAKAATGELGLRLPGTGSLSPILTLTLPTSSMDKADDRLTLPTPAPIQNYLARAKVAGPCHEQPSKTQPSTKSMEPPVIVGDLWSSYHSRRDTLHWKEEESPNIEIKHCDASLTSAGFRDG